MFCDGKTGMSKMDTPFPFMVRYVVRERIWAKCLSLLTIDRIFTEVPEKDFEGHYMPRRAMSPGMHAGLSVIMDVQEREYYCSATESVGFKVYKSLDTIQN